MAKKTRKTAPKPASNGSIVPGFVRKYPQAVSLIFILILFLILFNAVLYRGMVFDVPDARAPYAYQESFEGSGELIPRWQPYIFSGMPAYGSLMYRPLFIYLPGYILWLFLQVWTIFSFILPLNSYALHALLAAGGMILLLRRFNVDLIPATCAAIVFIFTPHLISMIVFSHGSKMMSVAYIPLILWAIDRLLHRTSLLNLGLAAMLIGFQMQRAHIQIVYYTMMLIGAYAAFVVIREFIRQAPLKENLMRIVGFVSVIAIGFMLAAILYLPVHEYTPYSIRGGTDASGTVQSAGGGVGYDYATGWSFHPKEIATWVVPGFFGFGGPTYWGHMPFTDFPNYMGILTLVLAVFAFIYRRRPLAWFLLGVIGVSLVISFGKFFFVYELVYNYLPFFNKFRVPVMILILAQFSFAVLAGFGLQNILDLAAEKKSDLSKDKSRLPKIVLYSAIGVFGLAILLTLAQSPIESFFNKTYPARYGPQADAQLNQQRFSMLGQDFWLVSIFLGLGLLAIWGYLRRKMTGTMLGAALILIIVIDLFIVDFRMMDPKDDTSFEAFKAEDDIAEFLQKDDSLFRFYPVVNFGENKWAAHQLSSIGGYNPAKLRIYRDFMDDTRFDKNVSIGQGQQLPYFLSKYVTFQDGQPALRRPPSRQAQADHAILNVLNAKYVISPFAFQDNRFELVGQARYQGQDVAILENKDLAPRAYVVGDYKVIPTRESTIVEMTSGQFDPRNYVILREDPQITKVDSLIGSAKVTHFDLHTIEISCESSHPALLVVSEVYYPDWHAYVDGERTEVYLANNVIRAVPIPAGEHTVVFRYESAAFRAGAFLTGAGYLIIIGLFVGAWFQRKREVGEVAPTAEGTDA